MGDAGLPVKWSYGDNDSLFPAHFVEKKGMLTITNIR
jgi:hypothetical protein